MPGLKQIATEINQAHCPNNFDIVRRDYIKKYSEYTKRNVIIYYSGWLQKSGLVGASGDFSVNDDDKNGFMATIHGLDRSKGLDLILHTPGGDIAATESIVEYLHSMFGHNIRAVVPQLAMSAGTMISCACNDIFMGTHSSLGPIDPQLGGTPAYGILEEFNRAYTEIKEIVLKIHNNPQDPMMPLYQAEREAKMATWQPIIAKYNPTLIGECEKAIEWSKNLVKKWLESGMLSSDKQKVKEVVEELSNHEKSMTHARHLSKETCKNIGLKISDLETDSELQDLVLSIHHSCTLTLSSTGAIKIIENQEGVAHIRAINK